MMERQRLRLSDSSTKSIRKGTCLWFATNYRQLCSLKFKFAKSTFQIMQRGLFAVQYDFVCKNIFFFFCLTSPSLFLKSVNNFAVRFQQRHRKFCKLNLVPERVALLALFRHTLVKNPLLDSTSQIDSTISFTKFSFSFFEAHNSKHSYLIIN